MAYWIIITQIIENIDISSPFLMICAKSNVKMLQRVIFLNMLM